MVYSVIANNGFGVYDNLGKLQEAEEFMKSPEIKEHKTIKEAKNYAIDIYNDYHNAYDDLDYYYDPDNDPRFRINWFYNKKYIKKLNSAD